MDLDYLIKYEDENTNLDFKKEEYNKDSYLNLLKDIMSMANALNNDVKRIIIGVKHIPGEDNILYGITTLTD